MCSSDLLLELDRNCYEEDLVDICENILIFPLFGGQPLTVVLFHCEFLNLLFEPFINFFSLRFPVWPWNFPATKPFVGSRGPDPGSEVKVCQKTPILLALSAVTCLRMPKSHLK